jgi:hypothetical protein
MLNINNLNWPMFVSLLESQFMSRRSSMDAPRLSIMCFVDVVMVVMVVCRLSSPLSLVNLGKAVTIVRRMDDGGASSTCE